jgi:hypothetical protein
MANGKKFKKKNPSNITTSVIINLQENLLNPVNVTKVNAKLELFVKKF